MSAADTIRRSLEMYVNSIAPNHAKSALAALDSLEAELAELAYWKEEAELKVERLTVGRATLEDQTNRAELAEVRVEAAEKALREAKGLMYDDSDGRSSYQRDADAYEVICAALRVLSGGEG